MSDEKPSPGPWRWERHRGEYPGRIVDARGESVINPSTDDPLLLIEEPDAALIADAPAMLELLRRLESEGDTEGNCPSCGRFFLTKAEHGRDCPLGALLDKHGRG